MTLPPFEQWLTSKRGRWCVAAKLTPRMRDKGYTVAIPPVEFDDMRKAYTAVAQSLATSLEPAFLE